MIQIQPRNRLLIDIFGKLLYLFGPDRYGARVAHVSRSAIYISLCTVLVTLPRLGQISYHFYDSRTLQYTPILICQMINLFQIDFTTFLAMQSHDHNWSLSLIKVTSQKRKMCHVCGKSFSLGNNGLFEQSQDNNGTK